MRAFVWFATAAAAVANVPLANSSPLYNVPSETYRVAPVESPVALRPTLSAVEPPAPLSPWSGFSVGVNLGGAWAGADGAQLSVLPVLPGTDPAFGRVLTSNVTSTFGGFSGGAQIGYTQRLVNGMVLGVEADFQGLTGKQAGWMSGVTPDKFVQQTTDVGAATFSKGINYLGTVRARMGYEVAPNILAYMTGGLAYGQTTLNSSSSAVWLNPLQVPLATAVSSPTTFSAMRTGWTLGGGVEFPIWTNLTAKIEYLYYDLGWVYTKAPFYSNTVGNFPGTFGTSVVSITNARYSGSIARFGLNYHFNMPTPALAPIGPISAQF
jgi:outer membrane immunogenic protein